MYSKMYKFQVAVSSNVDHPVTVTVQRIKNDAYGNPRYRAQVWIDTTGFLWSLKVKGYRFTKNDEHIITSHNIDEDIHRFMVAFKNTLSEKLK